MWDIVGGLRRRLSQHPQLMEARAPRSPSCILLYNPISGHGHLDSWNFLFVSILLRSGYRVLALTPDRDALQRALDGAGLAAHPMLCVLDWRAGHGGREAKFAGP